jgi:hypothetical protein
MSARCPPPPHTHLRGLVLVLAAAPAVGQAAEPAPAAPATTPDQTAASAAGDHADAAHGPHAHHVALFAGATTTPHSTAPSVGVDYLFYLPLLDRRIGVGPVAEGTFGPHLEVVLGLALAARSPIGLQLTAAPIVVLVEGERAFGGRLTVAYGWHFNDRWSIGPSVSADFLAHDTMYVYGLAGGLGF